MRKTIITFSLMAFLAACGTNPAQPPVTTVKSPAINQKPPITAPKASAFLELEVSGLGTELTPTATARFIKPGNLNSNAVTVQPVTGGSSLDDVQFTKNSVSFYDDSASSTRYVVATFNITNRFNFAWDNLTLYAVNTSSATGGTAVAGMWDASNTLLTDETKYRALLPAHGMMTGAGGTPAVNQNIADLQWFTPEEAYSVKTQAVTQSIIPNGSSVLQYGFVARNLSNGRGIAARDTSTNCTINDCKGTVTFAYSFPIGASNNPQRFRTQFVIGNETSGQISQSTQEQTANTVAGVTDVSSFGQARVLTGSTFAGTNKKPFGSIQTAIGTTSNPLAKLFPTPVSGGLDASFGTNGAVAGLSTDPSYNAVALQPDGKIVVVGGSDNFLVHRYNSDGSLDTSFDGDGKVITDLGNVDEMAKTVAIQPNGKIVVAGYTNFPTSTKYDFVVARYNSNGALDTTFDSDGTWKLDLGLGSTDIVTSVVIQPDGKILVGGYGTPTSATGRDFVVIRLTGTGTLDTTFDTDGITSVPVSGTNLLNAIALHSDGKIIAVGSMGFASGFMLAQLTSSGALDTTFNGNGVVSTTISGFGDALRAVQIQPDGKIVAAGSKIPTVGSNDFVVVRYTKTGTLDTTFDSDGIAMTSFGASNNSEDADSMVLQPDGKILVAGTVNSATGVARYNTDGSLDTSFDTDGKMTFVSNYANFALGMALQPDGKFVLVGNRSTLTRINP
jgi:uncharacterized delta-60 repeat protein